MDLHINLSAGKNLSAEIYRQVRHAIADGRLRPGDCLPASRDLARSLRVSRTTVTVAYDRLVGEGFLISRVGAGTYVSDHFKPAVNKTRESTKDALSARHIWESVSVNKPFERKAKFDFRSGLPDVSMFPHDAWRRLINREMRLEIKTRGIYEYAAGVMSLREAIARHIGVSRGVQTSAEDVTITNGAQQALDVIGRCLIESGDVVAVEDPGYTPPIQLFKSLGARVKGVQVDEQGIVVDALPRDTRLVYVTPSHQYPLGVTMSLPRRLALLEWAAQHNVAIIEDDYDSEFRFEERPLEPLLTLDNSGRVIYVGSFSKTLLPTLRLGFLVTPSSLTLAVHKVKYVSDWHTPTVPQAALARFIDDGGFARHIRKVGRVYAERRELIKDILNRDFARLLTVAPSIAGLHISALTELTSEEIAATVERGFAQGVAVQQLARFAVEHPPRVGLMFGYGAIQTDQIREGLKRLGACLPDSASLC
ncbi:MAG TPA: PLP-dependent aminotransferase family protein [Pyrinomonadaceae bacterium]